MGTVHHWQPLWSTTRVRYLGQCWYFNPQWTAGQAINKASCVSNSITHWKKCAVAMCRHMNQGFRRWGGFILATQRNPDLHGFCSLRKHCDISDRSE